MPSTPKRDVTALRSIRECKAKLSDDRLAYIAADGRPRGLCARCLSFRSYGTDTPTLLTRMSSTSTRPRVGRVRAAPLTFVNGRHGVSIDIPQQNKAVPAAMIASLRMQVRRNDLNVPVSKTFPAGPRDRSPPPGRVKSIGAIWYGYDAVT